MAAENYEKVAADAERPRRIRDWSEKWEQLRPVANVNGEVAARVLRFCEEKGIRAEALAKLDARVRVDKNGGVHLAFAGRGPTGAVTAIKYRPLTGSSHESKAEAPSVWLRPIVVGDTSALEWFVVEGETDSARVLDLVPDTAAVLCLPAGAATFKPEWADAIPRGATVHLCHDADSDGDKGAAKAARVVGGSSVRVRPPVEGGDWCDWAEGTPEEFACLVAEARSSTAAQVAWLSDAGLREAEFVEKPLLQVAFTLLAGRPGVGKGALSAHWVARCSNGSLYGEPRRVLWLSSEDDPEVDLGPRVEAAGGDRSRVALIPYTFRLPDDTDWLRTTAQEIGDVGLIIIDPVGNHTGQANTDRESEVRYALMPLAALSNELRVPIIGVRHITTKEAAGGAIAKILGSTAWVGVPRVVLVAVSDATDPTLLHVRPTKGNRVPLADAGRRYRLEGRLLPGFKETVVCATPEGESTIDVDAALAGKAGGESASEHARELLVETLQQAGGRMESDRLDAAVAQATGLSARTVKNLRGDMREKGLLRAIPEKDDEGEIRRWHVAVTNAVEAAAEPPQAGQPRARARAGACNVGVLDYSSQNLHQNPPEPLDTRPPRARVREGDPAETIDLGTARLDEIADHYGVNGEDWREQP